MRRIGFGLYLAFIVSWFLHAAFRVPILGAVRIDLVLAGLITALILLGSRDSSPSPSGNRSRFFLAVLVLYVILTVPFVQWPGSVIKAGLPNFLKAVVFYFFTAQLVSSQRRLRILITVFVLAQTLRVLEPLYLHLTQGYWGSFASMANWETMNRLAGAPSDVINPNGLAFVILTVLPFWHYLAGAHAAAATAYAAVLPASLYALVLTGSRSGFLGLAVVVFGIWLKSRRKILLAAVLSLGVLMALPHVESDTADRFLSIFSANTRNAATAQSRWDGVRKDLAVAMRRPLFGHGLGTSLEANANYRATALPSHNLYAEAAQEIGFIGLGLFLAMLGSMCLSLFGTLRLLRARGASPFVTRVANGMQVWLAMNILFSFASYGLSGYEWYLMAGLTDSIHRLSFEVSTPDTSTALEGAAAPRAANGARPGSAEAL
jgi:O-antigen ligase